MVVRRRVVRKIPKHQPHGRHRHKPGGNPKAPHRRLKKKRTA